MSFGRPIQIIWYINTVLTIFLLIRLRFSGLSRVYRWLWWYLSANVVEAAFEIPFQSDRLIYTIAYMTGRSVATVIAILFIMDLYQLSLVDHPAIARAGRRWAGWLLGTACTAAAAIWLILPFSGNASWNGWYRFYAFERTADSAIAFFLLLSSCLLIWFPLRVSKNVALLLGGLLGYFLVRWIGILAVVYNHTWTDNAGLALMLSILLCLIGAIVFLRPEGEHLSMIMGHRWNPEEMERLNKQLIAINAKLGDFSEKSNYISLQS